MSRLADQLKNPATTPDSVRAQGRKIQLTRLDAIETLPVHWLWQARIPRGMFGLLAGREGLGKSLIVIWLIAQITRGKLRGHDFGKPRKAIICATEDSFAHTIVPRLVAADADLTMVARVDVKDGDVDSTLNLPMDIPALVEEVKVNDVALIVLDPLTSRLSAKIDTHKDAEVRRALEPMARLAEDTDAAVLGLIHQNKSTANTDPNNLIMGSRAFSAVARYTLMVCEDPDREEDDPSFVLGQAKNSVGPSYGLPLMPYQIEPWEFVNERGVTIQTARIKWLDEDRSRTFSDVMRVGGKTRTSSARDDAERWLVEFLSLREGRKASSSEIKRAAEAAGHNERTIRRASDDVGIVREGAGPTTTWALPAAKLPGMGRATCQY